MSKPISPHLHNPSPDPWLDIISRRQTMTSAKLFPFISSSLISSIRDIDTLPNRESFPSNCTPIDDFIFKNAFVELKKEINKGRILGLIRFKIGYPLLLENFSSFKARKFPRINWFCS